MPLVDHFHIPKDDAHWAGIHSSWMTYLVRRLNREILGSRYLAESRVQLENHLEIDADEPRFANGPTDRTAPSTRTWAPPEADVAIPAVFPHEMEIRILDLERGADLVAAVEIVSPSNKDRAEARRAFVSKCSAYLQAGVGLVVVDVVTTRHHDLHDELVEWLGHDAAAFAEERWLYATAYRPRRPSEDASQDRIDIWRRSLAVGQPLPTMPLPLRNGPTVPLELEDAYEESRIDNRL